MKRSHKLVSAGAVALLLAGCGNSDPESAEDFPSQQIRFVIPYEPGGGTDAIFRAALPHLEDELGQTVVPVNIPGANATNGSRDVLESDADGYTLLGHHEGIINANLTGVVDYSWDAFEPVALISDTPVIAAVGEHTGWETAEDFIEAVEENPGEIDWGITPGGTSHFFVQMMLDELGLPPDSLNYVNYVATADALVALQSGEIAGTYMDHASAESQFESGAFQSIGVAHTDRIEELPDEPTFQEQGYDMVYTTARGIFAPEGTPPEIVDALSEAFETAVDSPEFQEQLTQMGSYPSYMPSDEYQGFLEQQEADFIELAEDMDL